MSLADELAYSAVKHWHISQDLQPALVAMLKNYGEAVRRRDVEVCADASPNNMDIGGDDLPHQVFDKTRKGCAAAIENEPLP